jgi:hypothetical protein
MVVRRGAGSTPGQRRLDLPDKVAPAMIGRVYATGERKCL